MPGSTIIRLTNYYGRKWEKRVDVANPTDKKRIQFGNLEVGNDYYLTAEMDGRQIMRVEIGEAWLRSLRSKVWYRNWRVELLAPTNLRIEERCLVWDKVFGACQYQLRLVGFCQIFAVHILELDVEGESASFLIPSRDEIAALAKNRILEILHNKELELDKLVAELLSGVLKCNISSVFVSQGAEPVCSTSAEIWFKL